MHTTFARSSSIVVLVALVLTLVAPPAVARDDLEVGGAVQATARGRTLDVSLRYRPAGTVLALRVSLRGPAADDILHEVVGPTNEVVWTGSRTAMPAGTYTVTMWAQVDEGGTVREGSESRTVTITAAAQPAPAPTTEPEARDQASPDPGGGSVNAAGEPIATDIVVYGATPSGILAAVSAARLGARVALIEPTAILGGMMGNGLTATDYGHPVTIGGFTKEFFDRTQAAEGTAYGRWRFQPSTARGVFARMLSESGVQVYLNERLLEQDAVTRNSGRIISIRTDAGRPFTASVYIDASYEGDLMAQAGVSYRVGREAASEYSETNGGVRGAVTTFTVPSGVEPGFPLSAPGPVGSGDKRIQNSNYRLCFSTATDRVPFSAPPDYDPSTFDIAAAWINWRVARGQTPDVTWFLWPVSISGGKFDVNNNGVVSIGVYGFTTGYPDASYAEREAMEDWLRSYTQGFLYFLRADPRVPQQIRAQMAAYGLCRDEWQENGNWPYRFYLREGRRMIGEYVLRERDVTLFRTKPDTVAIASYAFDSHHVSRWMDGARRLKVEGGFWHGRAAATRWSIPYRTLTPRKDEVSNLLVSVTVSSSHVALASLRMEPQYMLMGEAAGVAGALASRGLGVNPANPVAVQAVNPASIRSVLRARGSIVDNYLFWDAVHSPFRSDIEATHLAGVTFGCTPVLYCPASALTREVMAAFLSRALHLPPASRDYFSDDAASPYQDAINRTAAAGITAGCGSGRYCPTATVTRGQMAAFLVRSFRPPTTTRDYFTDDETSMFETDINRLAASGITAGCAATRFCPSGLVTREQIAAFLRRALN